MHDLTYNIASGVLEGTLEGVKVHLLGGAGGRAGSKGSENWHLSGNPFATHIGGTRSEGTHVYGPLPLGEYELRPRPDNKLWISLMPLRGNMFGRNAFAIHGTGDIGSHGCIVIYYKAGLERLCRLVKSRAKRSRPSFRLRVIAIGQDLDRKLYTA